MSPDDGRAERQLKRLVTFLAAVLMLALVAGLVQGDGARAWGYVAAGAVTLALGGVAAARIARRRPARG